ncbi:MAG: 50S ribosomal protein L10 [Planctomycetota bacterium]
MSKRIKALIENEYHDEFSGIDSVAVVNPRGIPANATNKLRGKLSEAGVKMRVVKNTLARRASSDTGLSGFDSLLDGPSALVYPTDPNVAISAVARALVDAKKEIAELEFRGVFFDGTVYEGDDGMTQVSKLPTREEAIASVVTLALSPARNLVGAISAPGSNVAGILKTLEEKGN